ncbi:MAG: glycosyltransferase [Roseinatronobacter sp.]
MTDIAPPILSAQTLRQLRWVFDYYATHHLEVRLKPQKLPGINGKAIGFVEDISLRQGRLYLRGWSLAKELHLSLGECTLVRSPHLDRRDVADALGCDPRCGFEASLPLPPPEARPDAREVKVTALLDGVQSVLSFRLPGRMRQLRARTALAGQFLRDCMANTPDILRGLRRNDPELRRRIKAALRLDGMAAPGLLSPEAFSDAPAGQPRPDIAAAYDGITIILPVFNAFALLPDVISRVMRNTDLPWHLVVIEDCSTDPRVRIWLRELMEKHEAVPVLEPIPSGQITLIENDRNLGFIRSVNKGFEQARKLDPKGRRPVILLNSDAFVPQDWASRLVAPLLQGKDIASVTPFSNDAEILSVPIICARGQLEDGQGDLLDAAAANLPSGLPCVDLPTGVGFCMALAPQWLSRVEEFDTVFGRGYGEEVDWCRKIVAMGGRHLATPHLFVEHRGGESFGSELKQAALARNNALISQRYPGYDSLVQTFVLGDPLLNARFALALEWLNSLSELPEIPVYMAHSMGGGAEIFLQDQLTRQDPQGAVLVRMGGSSRIHLEVHTPLGRLAADCDSIDLVVQLLARLQRRRVIYSCAVGDPDQSEIPAILCALADGSLDGTGTPCPLEILFHDYLPVSPSYTLLDSDGVFRGVPRADNEDPAHQYLRRDGTRLDLATWQSLWRKALERAAALVAFSADSAVQIATAYPELHARIVLRPHQVIQKFPVISQRARPAQKGRHVIGVLGNINQQKGAAVLLSLAHLLRQEDRQRRSTQLVVIGRVDPKYDLGRDVTIHGPYEPSDLPALVQRYGVTSWLIPSIWPETFSFTTHECLATGMPVMAFDLGAQGAAVAAAENGHLIPLPPPDDRQAPSYAACVLAELKQLRSSPRNAT